MSSKKSPVSPDSATPAFTNQLVQEKSPYLLQHAHNPVDWYPWNNTALEAARTQDKPIFLSIGYSACHWCHVMERESFEDENIAQILNTHFISIKVDREERPDIDEIYMTAVQMMTGHGGWPLSAFLLPDGRPFYGGTYFPPDSRHGRIGFRSLITQLADAYENRRDEVNAVAQSITEDLRNATRQRPLTAPTGALQPQTLLQAAWEDMESRFDEQNGGFGAAPKFPPHHTLRLLTETRPPQSGVTMLTRTLDKMALGGIYDHIGGGFHRYATDVVWLLPHFEKMLYDNALLARVYAQAATHTGNSAYARIARETCDWVLRDMTDPLGGFHAALDADSEGEEGKYYVWTPEQVHHLLGAVAGAEFCARYNIVAEGNFYEEATGHPTGTNIPHLGIGVGATYLPDVLEPTIAESREKLRHTRDQRIPPGKDDKVITAWNGLMIGALAVAGKILNEPRYTEAAERAARFCLTTLRPQGELLRRYARGEAGLPAFLDDYAYLADGLLDLSESTGDDHWLSEACSLADTLITRFWDTEEGGFFFAGSGHEELIARSKDLFDGALPSANGVAARVLIRLEERTGRTDYGDKARTLLHIYRGMLHRAPQGTHTLLGVALQAFTEGVSSAEPVTLLPQGTNSIRVTPGESQNLNFSLQMASGYHVNARIPNQAHLIPTLATVTTNAPASIGPVKYPQAAEWNVLGQTLHIYHGEAVFQVPIMLATDAPTGEYHVTLTIRCQVCHDTACLPPQEFQARVGIVVPPVT